MVPTSIPNARGAGGFKAAPKTSKQRTKRNDGIVARKVTEKASVGRSTPIRTNPDPDPTEQNKEIGSGRIVFGLGSFLW